MTLQAEIGILKKELEKINDRHLLNAIRELIKFSQHKREEEILVPFTREQIIARAKISEKNILEGKVKSTAEIKKNSKELVNPNYKELLYNLFIENSIFSFACFKTNGYCVKPFYLKTGEATYGIL